MTPSSASSALSKTSFSRVMHNFLDFIDEKEESIKRIFKHRQNPEESQQELS